MFEEIASDPEWSKYDGKDNDDIINISNKLDISEVPVVVPALECDYEVSGFNEVRPDPDIRINAKEKFKVKYLILDNNNILSVYDKKVTLNYLVAANKTGVTLLYNDDFCPIEITGEALCTNSVKLVREIGGVKSQFDWDTIILKGKNLVPDDMFYVDPECLEKNGTIPYLLSKENKNIYLRRLAFKLSGKNSDNSDITPIFFSQWKDMITYIEENTSNADILISVLTDTNLGQSLKMPKKGTYATLTMTGGDFAMHDDGGDNYITYKNFVLPKLDEITLPEGKALSMVDFATDPLYAAELGTLPKDQYETTRKAVTFTGGVNLTGDTRFVDIKLNSQKKNKDYYEQFSINAGKNTLMLDKVYSDGYIKDVKSSGDLYLAGGTTADETMRFIGSIKANNVYFYTGYTRADKEINGRSTIQTYPRKLIDIIAEKAAVDTSIDGTGAAVNVYTKGFVKTKMFNSDAASNKYTTITLNPAKLSKIDVFGKTSAQILLKLTDNFDNEAVPVPGTKIINIKGDFLKNQLIFSSPTYREDFEIVRAGKVLKIGKVGYGYYMIDTSSSSENNYYANYQYAYESLNDAALDLNRMMSAAEYAIALPRHVRQIPKLTKLKSGSHSNPIKLVVDPNVLDDSVEDKEYIIGVKKAVMKALTGNANGAAGEFDWTSDITINAVTGTPITPIPNPIKIYVE